MTVLPTGDTKDTKQSNLGVSHVQHNPETEDKHRKPVYVSPVKLRPRFLSAATPEDLDKDLFGNELDYRNRTEIEIKHLAPKGDLQEDYLGFINHVVGKDLQDPLVHKHKYKFLVHNRYACNGDVFLLILIHSATDKYKERQEIRKTWGSVRDYNGASIILIFLLARPSNMTSLPEILKESRTYRDIVMGDFIDTYKNLTYKNVMGLHWTIQYCNHTKFVLKSDDDTMVDIYHLVRFLFQKSPDGEIENFMYCSTFRNQGPVRRPGDKWFVTLREYPYTKYPPYCEGFAYIMSLDVVLKLYTASISVPYYWIDDVYVTGFLAAKAGIYHHDMESGHAYNLMQSEHLSKDIQSSIFLLAKYSHHRKNWEQAWNDILAFNRIGLES